jgi:ATP-dependent RNA helicase DHX57
LEDAVKKAEAVFIESLKYVEGNRGKKKNGVGGVLKKFLGGRIRDGRFRGRRPRGGERRGHEEERGRRKMVKMKTLHIFCCRHSSERTEGGGRTEEEGRKKEGRGRRKEEGGRRKEEEGGRRNEGKSKNETPLIFF